MKIMYNKALRKTAVQCLAGIYINEIGFPRRGGPPPAHSFPAGRSLIMLKVARASRP